MILILLYLYLIIAVVVTLVLLKFSDRSRWYEDVVFGVCWPIGFTLIAIVIINAWIR